MKKRVIISAMSIILIIVILALIVMIIIFFSKTPTNSVKNQSLNTSSNGIIVEENPPSFSTQPAQPFQSKSYNYTRDDCFQVCEYIYSNQGLIDDCQGKCGLFNQQTDLDRYVNFIKALKQ
jgi:hypothetical protein